MSRGIELKYNIPWAISEIEPPKPVTASPESERLGRELALTAAREGYATWRYDRCQRCGGRYAILAPDCQNRKEHEDVNARLLKEIEVQQPELVGKE